MRRRRTARLARVRPLRRALCGLTLGAIAAQPTVSRTGAARWGPNGELLLHSDRSGTTAFYVMEHVGARPRRLELPSTARHVDWSPDGRWVAYSRATDGTPDLFVARVDGTHERRVTTDAGADVSPAWSPDGRRLAFMSDHQGSFDVWIVELATGRVQRVTTMPGVEGNPRWSPDGEALSFNSNAAGTWDGYVVSPRTGAVRRITAGDADEFITDWLPGGGFLMDRNDGGKDRVAVTDADGRLLRWLTDTSQVSVQPVVSRDGRWVAFTAYHGESTDVLVVSIDGGSARRALPRDE